MNWYSSEFSDHNPKIILRYLHTICVHVNYQLFVIAVYEYLSFQNCIYQYNLEIKKGNDTISKYIKFLLSEYLQVILKKRKKNPIMYL